MAKTCSKCGSEFTDDATLCPNDGFPLLLGSSMNQEVLRIGSRYVVEGEIARGGMGAIYKARHIAMDRTVAIKLLLADFSSDSDAMMRFQVEARAASSLNHPNIIKIFEFDFTDRGMPYLVMEFLEGMSLSSAIEDNQRIPYKEAVPLFIAISSALSHAHKRNVIHRDLKPSNIMLVPDDSGVLYPILVDFGIAKLFSGQGKTGVRLTQTGEVFGSPLYMSPEQCMAGTMDARSDVYSFGCVMYETLVGIPPINGKNFMALIHAHLYEEPISFSQLAPSLDVPPELEAIVFKCLEKNPDHRQQSMYEVQTDLMKFLGATTGQVNVVQAQSNSTSPSAPNVVIDPADPLADVRRKADAGEAEAQHELGWCYLEGHNCAQNYDEAFKWFSLAAEQGKAESFYWLATLYRAGQGVEKDVAQALKLYRRGADAGHLASQSCLGDMYELGTGVEVDYERAHLWHTRAAEKGHALSMWALGGLYENGQGIAVDEKLSAKWYLAAAEKGQVDAQIKIGKLYFSGVGVTMNLTEAAHWYMCAAQQGSDEAKVLLGHCYANGEGVPFDEEEAVNWMSYAAECGNTEALNYMGYWNENGMMGFAEDNGAAFRWYSKSALQKDSWAQFKLGCLSEFGSGVPVNLKQAFRWYEQSAKQGVKDAQFNLALCYRDGKGTNVDSDKYFEWLLKSGEQDYNLALLELGFYYEESDRNEAIVWYQKAADLGEQEAIERLTTLNQSSTMRSTI
ncbi:MAG: SEL1-like repeat protein [Cyanobacteria bacterium SZAS-4]|nr:SEL1-like repeat protein [Cyanobacteria bacterium SZAS-4]